MATGSNKGQTSKAKIDKIHGMLEALITDDTEAADEKLHDYLQYKMREIIMGEACDDDDDDDEDDDDDDDDDKTPDNFKKGKKSKKKEKDDDDDDDDEKVEEQDRSAQFARSGSVMSDAINGKIKFKNGGKKTIKKNGTDTKDNNTNLDKTKFKSGGKQPANTLEKTPVPNKFNDGREFDLGTTDK